MTKEYICPECGKPFYGRSNKIFCTVQCRNNYYYRKKNEPGKKPAPITISADETEETPTGDTSTKLTIISDNKVIIDVIMQICANNDIKVKSEEIENLPMLTPDAKGKFYLDGKMLYTSAMIASMTNTESKVLAVRASNIGVFPIARGPIRRNPKANLYTEEDAFKIMEALSNKK